MKHIFNLFVYITIFFLLSCGDESEAGGQIGYNNVNVIHLDSKENYKPLTSAIENVKAINLETKSESLISNESGIGRIIINSNKFYVFDKKFMAVKVFDSAGKYLFNIGKLGIGKGEFINLQDIGYYPLHKTIWFLCNKPQKIIEFSLNGDFVQEINNGLYTTNFAYESPNMLYYYIN